MRGKKHSVDHSLGIKGSQKMRKKKRGGLRDPEIERFQEIREENLIGQGGSRDSAIQRLLGERRGREGSRRESPDPVALRPGSH
jgi:hypothetical protein